MSLDTVCTGPSDFNSPNTKSAVWFQRNPDGSILRLNWQGKRLIGSLQEKLGFTARQQDGAWGRGTNERLRTAMTRLGMDPAIVRDGAVSRDMLIAGLTVLHTLGSTPSPARPTVQICVPQNATMPVWNHAAPNDNGLGVGLASRVVEQAGGQPADPAAPEPPPARWQRPTGSTVLSTSTDEQGHSVVVYRTSDSRTFRALIDPQNGQLIKNLAVAPDQTPPPGTVAPGTDPGTLAPGATQAPGAEQSPAVAPYANTTQPPVPMSNTRKAVIIGSVVVGVIALVGGAYMLGRPSAPPAGPALPPGPYPYPPQALPQGPAPAQGAPMAQAPAGVRSNPGGKYARLDVGSATVVEKRKVMDGIHVTYNMTVRFKDAGDPTGYSFFRVKTDGVGYTRAQRGVPQAVSQAILHATRAKATGNQW